MNIKEQIREMQGLGWIVHCFPSGTVVCVSGDIEYRITETASGYSVDLTTGLGNRERSRHVITMDTYSQAQAQVLLLTGLEAR